MARRVLVVGLGRFGRALAETLWKARAEVIALDSDAALIADVKGTTSAAFVGDVTDSSVLEEVGAREVDAAVVTFGEQFEASVLCVAALRELGVKEIVARAVTPQKASILERVGATRVVQPDAEAGERLALDLTSRVASDLLQFAAEFRVVPWLVPSSFAGRTVSSIAGEHREKVHCLGFRRAGSKTIELPKADTVLAAGDMVLVAGADDDVARVVALVE
jgi:trk system potassium uptake protein TrkA